MSEIGVDFHKNTPFISLTQNTDYAKFVKVWLVVSTLQRGKYKKKPHYNLYVLCKGLFLTQIKKLLRYYFNGIKT